MIGTFSGRLPTYQGYRIASVRRTTTGVALRTRSGNSFQRLPTASRRSVEEIS
jgi:hypothetical protein